jgi:hypothetical protein
MAIVSVSRWKASAEQAQPLAREIAPIVKAAGARYFSCGPCYSGPDTGEFYVAITFPDWTAFGRAMQTLSADPQYQRIYSEALKVGELQDRSVIISEDL